MSVSKQNPSVHAGSIKSTQQLLRARSPQTKRENKPMTQIVEFPPNIPQQLALKFADGKPITTNSNYIWDRHPIGHRPMRGPRVLFTLTDERVMFVDPPVADKIHALKLAPGQPFRMMRAEIERNGKTAVEWRVARLTSNPVVPIRDPKSEWLRCAEEAIDVLVEVREKAAAKELPVQFTGEDLRQVAATLYIGRGQDRRYSMGGVR